MRAAALGSALSANIWPLFAVLVVASLQSVVLAKVRVGRIHSAHVCHRQDPNRPCMITQSNNQEANELRAKLSVAQTELKSSRATIARYETAINVGAAVLWQQPIIPGS